MAVVDCFVSLMVDGKRLKETRRIFGQRVREEQEPSKNERRKRLMMSSKNKKDRERLFVDVPIFDLFK